MANLERTATLTVKVTEADAEAIKKAATRADMTVSDFMRGAALTMMVLDGDEHALRLLARGALRVTVGVWERIRGVVPSSQARATTR